MGKRSVFILFFLSYTFAISAQTYTEKLQQDTGTQGKIVIFHDQILDDLVNGVARRSQVSSENSTSEGPEVKNVSQMTAGDTTMVSMGKTYKKSMVSIGYRIQLYSGSDSRVSRQQAYAIGSKFKSYFPIIPVYTHFYSPRWICRAGDFRTYEEASSCLHQLQSVGGFPLASIVKCKIQIGL